MRAWAKGTAELVVFQVGSGPWQTEMEMGTGSSILHENLHYYLKTMVHRSYSFYQAAEFHSYAVHPPEDVFIRETPIWYQGKALPFPCVYDPVPSSNAIFFEVLAPLRETCLAGIERELENCLSQIRAETGVYPDLIYMHHASFNAMAMLKVFQKLGESIPMCVHLHGTELKAASEFGEAARVALEQVLAIASRSLYISTDNKDHLMRLVPNVDRDRLVYFPPWLNEKNFYPAPSGERSVAEPTVVLISRLSAWKRIEALILAAKYLVSKTGAHIDLIGEGPHSPQLEGLVAEKGMRSHVTFHGFIAHHDLGDFLRKRASVVVNTSPVEPFGMTVIEALACGVPVIATNRGGPADIVTPEIGQLIEDHPDVEVYAERLSNTILKALTEDWKTLKGPACVAAAKKFGIHSRRGDVESLLHATIGH